MFLLYSSIQVSFEYLSHLLALGLFLGVLLPPTRPTFILAPRLSMKVIVLGIGLCAIPYIVAPFFASRLWVGGNTYIEQKKWASAEASFHSSLALDNRSWEPHWGLAQVAAARADFSGAVHWGEQALERNKLDFRLKQNLEKFKKKSSRIQ